MWRYRRVPFLLLSKLMTNKKPAPAGLYVHIPFCKTKCPYCDFYSVTDQKQHVKRFLKALATEMSLQPDGFSDFDSIYLGGGTPSCLEDKDLEYIFAALHRHFSFSEDTEITMEVNPDDITADKLRNYRDFGVNRISVGVQSFDEKDLLFLGRRHTAKKAREAINLIQEAGFKNFGIDLMNGLPEQTLKRWEATLQEAISLRPVHISCYQLTVADSTPFGKMFRSGNLSIASEKRQRDIFLFTSKLLTEKGYVHYEISNFARGMKYRSRHNMKYWDHTPYLGLGPAAHSFIGNRRWWNSANVSQYYVAVERKKNAITGIETLSAEQLDLETLLLGVRTRKGVSLKDIKAIHLDQVQLQRFIRSGKFKMNRGRLIPTIYGYLMADRLPVLLTS